MFYREVIEKKSLQVINCINNFLNVFKTEDITTMKLDTKKKCDSDICYLTIIAKRYNFSKELLVNSLAKRLLYDRIFWKVFDNYKDNDEITIMTNILEDLEKGYSWQLIMRNSKLKNTVVLDFGIESEKDYRWITETFERFSKINNDSSKQKKLK